jgi:putative Holliday junction resolvase
VRLGIDVGTVRIGVSRSDPHGMLATPVETVPRVRNGDDRRRIAAIAMELGAIAAEVDVPVRLVDERLSTVSAQSALRASGKGSKAARPIVDQVAATIILQHALDVERAGGRPPGTLVEPSIGS